MVGLLILWITLGFILLIKGADILVKSASSIAKKYRVPELVIGLTIVAFGTSAPEMVVNIIASSEGRSAIVFGNIIGSNNFNIFIILGIAATITPMTVKADTVWKEIPIALISVLVFYLLAGDWISSQAQLSRLDGTILLVLFLLFLMYIFRQFKKTREKASEEQQRSSVSSSLILWASVLLGLIGLVLGGKLIVDNAVSLANLLGLEERIIGLTIIAAGTSLPELATSVVAALKKNNDIAVGNIIGSNIFNIFLVTGLSAVISPLHFDKNLNTDILLLAIGSLILFLAMFTGKKKKLDRWEAILLLALYLGYTVYIIAG